MPKNLNTFSDQPLAFSLHPQPDSNPRTADRLMPIRDCSLLIVPI